MAQWKDGKTIPDMYNFKRTAEFFKVPYEYLLGDTDSMVHENMALESSLGLSDDAIETLQGIKEFSQHDDNAGYISTPEVVSRIICNGYFDEFLKLVQARNTFSVRVSTMLSVWNVTRPRNAAVSARLLFR
ncbi:MAG: hypothetical protein VB058_05430 [Oscillospiraceae bacterium]|nr:hypothetical protein [Oscillospiraceae bacterium]